MSKCGITDSHLKTGDNPFCRNCEEFVDVLMDLYFFERGDLKQLAKRESNLISSHNKIHDPFILRLPVEISSMIFTWCSTLENPHLDHFDRKHIPFARSCALAAVCKGWREIALSTPQLWTCLHFHRGYKEYYYVSQPRAVEYLKMVKVVLARSKSLPLTFSISGSHAEKKTMDKLIALLETHIERWHEIDLYDMDAVLYFRDRKKRGSHNIHTLRTWALGTVPRRGPALDFKEPKNPLIVQHFKGCHLLPSFMASWSHLRTVDQTDLSADEVCKVLSLAINLETAIFFWLTTSMDLKIDVPRLAIRHTTLRKLELRAFRRPGYLKILSNIFIPNLSHLSITSFTGLGRLVPFLRRSGCKLETLSVESCSTTDEDLPSTERSFGLVDVLAHTPLLKELHVEDTPSLNTMEVQMGRPVLLKLCETAIDSTNFLPVLEKLELCVDYKDPLPWGHVTALFHRTKEGLVPPMTGPSSSARLQSILIQLNAKRTLPKFQEEDTLDRCIDKESLQKMHSIIAQGFDLKVVKNRWHGLREDFIKTSDDFWSSKHEVEL